MRTDGRLDEAIYQDVHPASGFIQMEPDGGQPATERTEVWVFYDDENVYVSFRAWESQPDRMITNEMRRDSGNIRQGDSLEFAFDTSAITATPSSSKPTRSGPAPISRARTNGR
jgi:hypothetical protein